MRQREQIAVDLKRRDDDEIASDVEARIADALARRVRIAFDYYSPKNPDAQPRRHVVDPYERYFDTQRGHYYLKGYCYYAEGPDGRDDVRSYVTYRLGRIENVQVLSNRLPPTPPPTRTYKVVYELSSEVVGESVSRQNAIDIDEVEWRDDGSVLVRGTTESIFWAVQSLMHYRHHCKLLAGPEMVHEMRKTVRQMADLYKSL